MGFNEEALRKAYANKGRDESGGSSMWREFTKDKALGSGKRTQHMKSYKELLGKLDNERHSKSDANKNSPKGKAAATKRRAVQVAKATRAQKVREVKASKATRAQKVREVKASKATRAQKVREVKASKATRAQKVRAVKQKQATRAQKVRAVEKKQPTKKVTSVMNKTTNTIKNNVKQSVGNKGNTKTIIGNKNNILNSKIGNDNSHNQGSINLNNKIHAKAKSAATKKKPATKKVTTVTNKTSNTIKNNVKQSVGNKGNTTTKIGNKNTIDGSNIGNDYSFNLGSFSNKFKT